MSGEINLEFVDTNIFVYAYDLSAGKKHITALALVRRLWDSGQGGISIQVLQELFVNLTRKVNPPLEIEIAAKIIRDLSTWHMIIPGIEDVRQAIEICQLYRISFWDAMIIQSAERAGCKQIWSEDLNSSQVYGQVGVFNPFVQVENRTSQD